MLLSFDVLFCFRMVICCCRAFLCLSWKIPTRLSVLSRRTRAFYAPNCRQMHELPHPRDHDTLQWFFALNLLLWWDLHVMFFAVLTKMLLLGQIALVVVVSAYDLRCDLTGLGSGSVSIEYTLRIRLTMVRQQSSWSDKTVEMKKKKREKTINFDVPSN